MITKFLPLPDNNGGHQRSLAIARRLAKLGDLVLCGYDDGTADHDGLRDLGIDVRAVPWRVTPVRAARGVVATHSVSAGRFWSAAMVKAVRRAADEGGIDLLQVEYQQMVPPVRDVPAKKSILDLHNVESALVDSYARARTGVSAALYRGEAAALRRMERRTIGAFDHVVVVSEQERVRMTAGARSILVCPNGREPSAVLPDAPDPTVAFVATMGWAPNVDAAVWLAREIWPEVRGAGSRGPSPARGQGPRAGRARPGRLTHRGDRNGARRESFPGPSPGRGGTAAGRGRDAAQDHGGPGRRAARCGHIGGL